MEHVCACALKNERVCVCISVYECVYARACVCERDSDRKSERESDK